MRSGRARSPFRATSIPSGFTLLELLIVMVLGMLILGWAMGRIDVAELRVRSAEQQVSTTLLTAQQRAVMKQHDVRVLFDTVAHRILVHEDLNNNGARAGAEPLRTIQLEEGVMLSGAGTPGSPVAVTFAAGPEGMPELTFHRGGYGSANGSVHVGTVRSARGHRPGDARRLVVNRATGRVTRFYVSGGAWVASRS